jgi:plastocyanin domain-containing protein
MIYGTYGAVYANSGTKVSKEIKSPLLQKSSMSISGIALIAFTSLFCASIFFHEFYLNNSNFSKDKEYNTILTILMNKKNILGWILSVIFFIIAMAMAAHIVISGS